MPRNLDGSFNLCEKNCSKWKDMTGFNPRSPQQLKKKPEQAGVMLRQNKKGELCLDQNLLAYIRKDKSLTDAYLRYKAAVMRLSHIETLLNAVGPDGQIHASYRQMGTKTGRLSCSTPNLRQVPWAADFAPCVLLALAGSWLLLIFRKLNCGWRGICLSSQR